MQNLSFGAFFFVFFWFIFNRLAMFIFYENFMGNGKPKQTPYPKETLGDWNSASKKIIRLLWGGKIRRHPAALTVILKPNVLIEWVQELISYISRLINDNETKFQTKAGF